MKPEVERILKLDVPIIVRLAERTMKLREVTSLVPGTIIELPVSVDGELVLQVNNKALGAGTAVKVGENFGIKITYIGDLKSRVRALGGQQRGNTGSDEDAEQSQHEQPGRPSQAAA